MDSDYCQAAANLPILTLNWNAEIIDLYGFNEMTHQKL